MGTSIGTSIGSKDPPPTYSSSLMEGWLKKRSGGNKHVWQDRFFVITNEDTLLYFGSDAKEKLKGTIEIGEIAKVELAKEGKGSDDGCRLNIHLKDTDRVFALIADSTGIAKKWQSMLET